MDDIIAIARIRSRDSYDTVKIVKENGNNDIVVFYRGNYCTAVYNPFVGGYYVDDVDGKIDYKA